ncbi:hypothetical protein SAMN04488072_104126 [Lentibacillus halodurans]|uniref:Uncharacterized protein n=1 Tax=Lentibacillus halodurans TaxID=237679 RepID=A0A1I0X526_9BACI|nr:hypothetical protein [Lentibacillus halodurans]SFA95490.1 hypothetical protein SAMN04488072_104126 [Lentibacillus halodurans]
MKNYIIFTTSFILLFSLFQILSGLFLTFTYTPGIEEAWNMSAGLPEEAVIISGGSSFLRTLIFGFLAATIAYFIPKKMTKNTNRIN